MSTTIDGNIESILRALKPGQTLKTVELVNRVRGLGEHLDGPAIYKRVLALAPRCPSSHKDKDHAFVRFGRTCYPWVWGYLADDQPLSAAPKPVEEPPPGNGITLDDGMVERIAQRVVSLLQLSGELTMATVAGLTDQPELCVICGQTKPQSEFMHGGGICTACIEEMPDEA